LAVYADDANILGGSYTQKNTDALVVARKESGLEVNAIKLSTRSCLEIRMQAEVTIYKD